MCNCGATSGNYKFSIKGCNKNIEKLTLSRNRILTLYNITTDAELKEEYRISGIEIDDLLKTYYGNKICPETTLVYQIQQYIENEYSKHNA